MTAPQNDAGLPSQAIVEIDQAEQKEIVRAQAGDWLAWEALVNRYQENVFRLAYLIVGESSEAQDVAQDTFIHAYKALSRFQIDRPFRPWLLQITRNQARNKRRSIGRYWAAVRRFLQQEVPDPFVSQQEARFEARRLHHVLGEISPTAAEIIYLRFFLELSVAETADTLGIKPGTVKSRLHRALAELRERIEMDYPELVS